MRSTCSQYKTACGFPIDTAVIGAILSMLPERPRLLATIDPAQEPPRAVRVTGVPPWHRPMTADGDLIAAVQEESAFVGAGRLGVILPARALPDLGRAVARAVPETALGDQPELESRVVVLTVAQARGLEFDSVIVVDPAAILAESPRGRSDLYVAVTRATQRLGILHHGPLPAELDTVPA